ncbi:MAG TPA: hypothetical protein VKG79_15790, partial [Bryobacteraceae bacterium]|nr:hypothetical protein [Bryobacteraceae bacterium]
GATGTALVQAGYFVKLSSRDIRRMDVVRHTKLARDGSVYARITRIAIELRHTGRAYLTMTEIRPADAVETEPTQGPVAVRRSAGGAFFAARDSSPARQATTGN